MIKEVVMPKAGLTMVEGTITDWLASEGAKISKGDPIMEYENEKNTIECEALSDGILHIAVEVGETVPVGEPIGYLADTEEEYNSLLSGDNGPKEETVQAEESDEKGCARECPTCVHVGEAQEAAPVVENQPALVQTAQSGAVASAALMDDGHVRASGLARKMAAEAGIDLKSIPTENSRLNAKDVEAYLKNPKPVLSSVPSVEDEVTVTPWIGIKKTIANNMLNSMQTTAQCTCMMEADVTELLALRARLVEKQDVLGCKISINDILCKMLGKVMAKHPLCNATFDGKNLYSHKRVHLSVAVATENGLMVPVLRNVDTMTLVDIHNTMETLVKQAKEKSLPLDAQSGGTCMVTNFGVFHIDFSTPVMNPPQTCITGFGRPKLKPAVLPDGTMAPRQMMHVVFTFDHQVIDGLEVGKVFQDIKEYIENPELILV